jgi:hypothetical protein
MKLINLSENVMVSDPCYSLDTWCQTKLNNVLPGNYIVDVDYSDEGSWGNRVSGITVLHESITGGDLDWDYAGECGVDSGQCGIFCMTGYRNDEIAESITSPDTDFVLPYNDTEGDKWYEKMCRFTLGEDKWGMYDTGVVTSSGIGDGMYPLYVVRDGDKIVGMRVEYLGDSDEDEGDCCGVCGIELESDGTCDYCSNENKED